MRYLVHKHRHRKARLQSNRDFKGQLKQVAALEFGEENSHSDIQVQYLGLRGCLYRDVLVRLKSDR